LSDPLARWQHGWPGTRRIVVAGGAASVLGSETKAAIADAGLELLMATLRDPSGNVTPEAAEAEVIISGGTPLDAAAFNALEGARFLLRPYVGYDDIDVDAATARGILVANVPDTFIQEVADHALALLLAANRKLFEMDRFVRDGRWFRGEVAREVAHPMRRLSTMTLGLLGFGNIARLVAARALPFGLRIIAHDPYVPADAAAGTGVTMVSRDDLLREARAREIDYEIQDEDPGTQVVRMWGDTAVVTARLRIKGRKAGQPFDRLLWFSDTYVRTSAGWRYAFGQASLPLPDRR
jgi:D-3-phosphoglycerate dehydrogenase